MYIIFLLILFLSGCQDEPRKLQDEYASKPTVLNKEAVNARSFTVETPESAYQSLIDSEYALEDSHDTLKSAFPQLPDNYDTISNSMSITCADTNSNLDISTKSQILKLALFIKAKEEHFYNEYRFNLLCRIFRVEFNPKDKKQAFDVYAALFKGSDRLATMESKLTDLSNNQALMLQPLID
jgi:hypothetical protein